MAENKDGNEQKYDPFKKGNTGAGGDGTENEVEENLIEEGAEAQDPALTEEEENEFGETIEMPSDDFTGESNDGGTSTEEKKNLFDDLKGADKDGTGDGKKDDKKNLFDDDGAGGGEKKDEEKKDEESDDPKEGDTGMTDEFAQFTAKWLVDVYAQTFCMFMKNLAKINKKSVYEAIIAGHLNEKFLKHIEEANAKVDEQIKFTDEQKKFIIEPLTRFVKVKKVKVPSGLQLLIGLGVVSGAVFMTANEIRKDNEFLLNRIILESQNIREAILKKKKKYPENEFNIVDDENKEEGEENSSSEESSEESGEFTDTQE